jgi:hypothetical protein
MEENWQRKKGRVQRISIWNLQFSGGFLRKN